MGEVLAAIGSFEKAKKAYDGVRGGDPGIPDMGNTGVPQGAPVPNYGSQGDSQASSNTPAIQTPMQALDQSMSVTPPPIAPAAQAPSGLEGVIGNLFGGDFSGAGTNAQYAASNIQSPQAPQGPAASAPLGGSTSVPSSVGASAPPAAESAPLNVQGNQWQPHKESTLGKIGDALLMMKGMQPIFRERTAQANQREVMQNYYKQMGSHPTGQAMDDLNNDTARRLDMIPGLDPKVAEDFTDSNARDSYYSAGENMRNDNRATKGMSMLSSMASQVAAIKDPAQQATAYQSLLPAMRAIGSTYGVDDNVTSSLLGDQFDPTKLQALAKASETPYDQFREQYMTDRGAATDAYHQDELNLRQQGLKIETANLGVRAAEANSNIDRNNTSALNSRRLLYNNIFPPAIAQVPWLYNGFLGGTFGKTSNGMPVPNTMYVSPDKSAGFKMDSTGNWTAYRLDLKHGKARPMGHIQSPIRQGVSAGAPSMTGDVSSGGSDDFEDQ